MNKAFLRERLRVTLYAEVLNVLNHDDSRYLAASSVDPNTGAVTFANSFAIPFLAVLGMTMEF